MSKTDFYQVLGVDKNATAAEIKSTYRKKALEFHPDRNKAPDAEQKFKQITEAYEVLSNPEKRAQYDRFGHAAFDQSAGFGGANGFQQGRTGPFTYSYQSSGTNPFEGFDFSDPFEIFESFFGAGGFSAQQKPRYSLKIDFLEAVEGAKRTIVHQGKSHTITIPAGADDGTRIRYSDFDVTFDVKPHPEFKRQGDDIYTTIDIPFTTAALGDTIEVPTLKKPVKIKIRPGTQPNTMIRLKDQGVTHLRGGGHGDHYVRLNITFPKSLTKQQKDLLKQFEQTLH